MSKIIKKRKDAVAYNIVLDGVEQIRDFDKYILEYETLEYLLCEVLGEYKGYCKMSIDIGQFEIMPPDLMVKKLTPYIHIVAYGTNMRYFQKKLDEFLDYDFVNNTYTKVEILDNPFNVDNQNLFKALCYKQSNYTVDGKTIIRNMDIGG